MDELHVLCPRHRASINRPFIHTGTDGQDRGNISNATAGTLLEDLNLTQADYNLGNTLFRVGFLVAELPSQIIGKRFGVDIWLPTQMCIFSICKSTCQGSSTCSHLTVAMSQFAMQGRTSFLALRFLIAFFQGGCESSARIAEYR